MADSLLQMNAIQESAPYWVINWKTSAFRASFPFHDAHLGPCPKLELSMMYWAVTAATTQGSPKNIFMTNWCRKFETQKKLWSTNFLLSSKQYADCKLHDRYVRVLFRRFPEGEHALGDTGNRKANNNSNHAITNFSGDSDSGRRQINRMPDIQSRECDGVSYTHI